MLEDSERGFNLTTHRDYGEYLMGANRYRLGDK